MSAWLCGNKTLSLVVDVIKSDSFKKYDDNMFQYIDNEELIDILSELNTMSLNCRYGKHDSNILHDREYVKLNVDDGQRFKSVSCWLYQSGECYNSYDDDLYQALEAWCDDNELKYNENYDEYEWDIDNPIDRKKLEVIYNE